MGELQNYFIFCSIPQAWQLAAGKDCLFFHQRKQHNFGLTDGAVPQPRWGHGELSPEVTGHQLARERDISGGFLTLIFPLLPVPA